MPISDIPNTLFHKFFIVTSGVIKDDRLIRGQDPLHELLRARAQIRPDPRALRLMDSKALLRLAPRNAPERRDELLDPHGARPCSIRAALRRHRKGQ
jgi:hypothetical protein